MLAGYDIVCMDEFVDQLLNKDRVCDVILPRLAKRTYLEDEGVLDPRKSPLEELLASSSDDASDQD